MSVTIVVNPLSGTGGADRGERRYALASRILAASGEHGEVFKTEHKGHAGELAREAVRRGRRLVIAWGGDGTINEIGAALIGTDVALGVVRSGSGNALARELRVSRQPHTAITEAMAAQPRLIDAGDVDGRPFFCVAGIGFDQHVSSCFDTVGLGRRGFTTYARLSLREIWRYRPAAFKVDEQAIARGMLIAVANTGQFGNGATIAPGARLDDGLLDLVTFDERTRLATVLALPRLYVGGLERVAGVARRAVDRVTIESDRPIAFHADGEAGQGGTRIEVRVLPSVLRVAVR